MYVCMYLCMCMYDVYIIYIYVFIFVSEISQYNKVRSYTKNHDTIFQFARHVSVCSSNHHQLNIVRFIVRIYNNTTLSIEYINGKEERKQREKIES